MTQFNVTRPLVTKGNSQASGSEYDLAVNVTTSMIIAGAYQTFSNYRSAPDHTKSGFDGSFTFTINANGTVIFDIGAGILIAHGWGMWASWGLFGFIQIACSRYFRVWWKASMLIHRLLGFMITLATIVFSVIVFYRAQWNFSSNLHSFIGIGILIIVLFLAIGGIVTR